MKTMDYFFAVVVPALLSCWSYVMVAELRRWWSARPHGRVTEPASSAAARDHRRAAEILTDFRVTGSFSALVGIGVLVENSVIEPALVRYGFLVALPIALGAAAQLVITSRTAGVK
jgi:hypothetical protein